MENVREIVVEETMTTAEEIATNNHVVEPIIEVVKEQPGANWSNILTKAGIVAAVIVGGIAIYKHYDKKKKAKAEGESKGPFEVDYTDKSDAQNCNVDSDDNYDDNYDVNESED